MPRGWFIPVLLLLTGTVMARQYSVDSAGGPLTLHEDVAGAFSEWSLAGAETVPSEAADADTLFRFASPDRMGPDTLTLTLQRSSGRVSLEVLVQPELYRDHPGALLHEAGLVLGLSQQPEGVMRPLLSPDGPIGPGARDVELLRSSAAAVPGDLNRDGRVDFLDLVELARQFERRGVNLPGDLDGDGVVTRADLVILRETYVFTLPGDPAAGSEDAEPETAPEPDTAAEPESVPEQEAVPEADSRPQSGNDQPPEDED